MILVGFDPLGAASAEQRLYGDSISTMTQRVSGRSMLVGKDARQIARYLLTGAGLYLVDFLVFVALALGLHVHVALSQFVARATGAIVGFVAHRQYTFRENRERPAWGLAWQGGGYLAVSILTLFLSPVLIMVTMWITSGHKIGAKLLAEPLLILIAYLGLRVVFRARE